MLDAFVEGARSIVQACHMVILAPVAMIVLAGRARWQFVVGAVVGIVLGGWLFATRWLVLDDTQIRWSSLLLIAAAASVVVLDRRHDDEAAPTTSSLWAGAAIAASTAVVVTAWWRPCVGEELGDILTRAPREPWGQLPPTTGFMLGVSIPIVLVGLAVAAWQPSSRATGRLVTITGALAVVFGLSVLAGQHGEIVATLFDWSQPFV